MTYALQILELLENTPSKNDKIQILKNNVDNTELVELLDAAFNFSRKFYMNKFSAQCELTEEELKTNSSTHYEFIDMLNLLERREITGNGALQYVEHFFAKCTPEQIKWYSRILKKDLRAGFSISSANKAGFNIPEFKVMLATDAKKCKKIEEIVSKGVYVSPKLDGYRCLAVVEQGSVTLYSRNGKVYKNFPSIEEELSKLEGNWVLDGEIMSDDFQAMQKTAFNDKDRGVSDVIFHVFDIIRYDEWVSGDFKQSKRDRVGTPLHIASLLVQRVVEERTTSLDRVLELEQQYLSDGLEGAMVVPEDCVYYLGRKANKLMKFKTMETMDCEILSLVEGNGKFEGHLGKFIVKQENDVECEVGTGYDTALRLHVFHNPQMYIGRTIEVKYQELTSGKQRMRFPVFMRFRDDK